MFHKDCDWQHKLGCQWNQAPKERSRAGVETAGTFKDRREGDAWREEGWSKQGCGLPAEPGRESLKEGYLKTRATTCLKQMLDGRTRGLSRLLR